MERTPQREPERAPEKNPATEAPDGAVAAATIAEGERPDRVLIEEDPVPTAQDERVADLVAHTIDVPVLAAAVERQDAPDAADTLEDLRDEAVGDVLVAMDTGVAAEALSHMAPPLAAGVLQDLVDEDGADYAAELLGMMAADDAADVLQQLDVEVRETILGRFPRTRAIQLRRLVAYDEETAAGLMTTDFVGLEEAMAVRDAIRELRERTLPEDQTHLPVVDKQGRLVGIVALRTLLVARRREIVGDLMDRTFRAIRAGVDREDVARAFDRYDAFLLPVVDASDHLLGIITVDDVLDIIRAEHTEDAHRSVGAGAGEAIYSGVLDKFRGRFPWLVVSLFITVPAAWVVLQFESLIGELAILAMLMPVVAAVAGNAGHQALAVTLRGIVLDEVREERVARLLRREVAAGVLNGLGLGLITALSVGLLSVLVESASWQLGAVVAGSLACSVTAGTLAGSFIPLAMKRLGADPAQSSAIFLIMVTDAVAFASFLGSAHLASRWLLPVG